MVIYGQSCLRRVEMSIRKWNFSCWFSSLLLVAEDCSNQGSRFLSFLVWCTFLFKPLLASCVLKAKKKWFKKMIQPFQFFYFIRYKNSWMFLLLVRVLCFYKEHVSVNFQVFSVRHATLIATTEKAVILPLRYRVAFVIPSERFPMCYSPAA